MQSAETVLDVLRERGRRGLPLDELYRQLFNPQLYLAGLRAHLLQQGSDDARTRRGNRGRHDAGQDRAHHRRAASRALPLQARQARTTSRRRTGSSGRLVCHRGRTSCSAKWSACCWRRTTSRSSPTAPTVTAPAGAATPHCARWRSAWTGTTWFIEGDISRCFDRLDHRVMLETLGEKIHDNRLLRLIGQMLQAGYLEDWVWNATLSGAPQGGVLSPCLSNIYLDRLDKLRRDSSDAGIHPRRAQETQP